MKRKKVGVFEAKTHLSSLLDAVEEGTLVYITRHGRTIAELRPVAPIKRPRFGSAQGPNFRLDEDFDTPLEDFEEYSR